jgi:hypothetical protein
VSPEVPVYSSFFDCGEQQDFSDDEIDWHDLDWDLDPEERLALLDEYNEEMAWRVLLDEQDARDEYRRADLAGWATPDDEIPF